MADDKQTRRPRTFREPDIEPPSKHTRVPTVRDAIDSLFFGDFRRATKLIDQMWMNPRFRVALSTRLAGLTGAEERWTPGRDNRDGRAAVKAIKEDWPLILPRNERKEFNGWGLVLGFGLAQGDWVTAPSKRIVPALQAFRPGWCYFDWATREYVVDTKEGEQRVAAPRPGSRAPMDSPWIVHEPFGRTFSWRRGYVISAWYTWLGHDLATAHRLRTSEKLSGGTLKAKVPHGQGQTEAGKEFRDGLRNRGANTVIVCEQLPPDPTGQPQGGFDVEPLEFTAANGYQVIDQTAVAMATDMTILFLGGNLQTEVKGGGSYAAVAGQGEVRTDYKIDDAAVETSTLCTQLIERWAEVNFEDPENAPQREVFTDPPQRDQARATMVNLVGQSIDNLVRNGADGRALMEEFRIPLAVGGITQVQVPGAPPPPPSAPSQPNGTPAQPNDGGAQPSTTPEQNP